MHRLLHDRYLASSGPLVRDLATGVLVARDSLQDANGVTGEGGAADVGPVLDSGREGRPQHVRLAVPEGVARTALVEAVATTAQRRGYVPVAATVFPEVRLALGEDTRERAFVLIADEGQSTRARLALMAAAATSTRPHTLVTIAGGVRADAVREARTAYGGVRRSPVAMHPDVVALVARATRAEAFVREGRHAAAVRLLRETAAALERRTAMVPAAQVMTRLAWLFYDRGRLDEAQAAAGEVVRLGELAGEADLAADAYLLTALVRIDLVRLTEAEALARAVLLSGGQRAFCARAVLARCLVEQHRSRELQLLPLDEEPDVADLRWRAIACESITTALVSLGRTSDAGRWLRRVTEHWPDRSDVHAQAVLATAHLRVVLTTGDERLVHEAFARAMAAARAARMPMRALQARVIRCTGLHRETSSAVVDCCGLRRLLRCATPMLRRDAARRRQDVLVVAEHVRGPDASLVATLLELAQHDEDRAAIEAVVARTRDVLQAARVEVVSREAGPVSTLVAIGGSTPAGLGARVLDAGFAIDVDGPPESGVPIRVGARLIGAVIARWTLPGDPPPDRRSVLECAAIVLAGRLDSHLHQQRTAAAAATEVSELVGVSAAITELRRAVLRAARAPFAVLIEGESGVGKELVARAVHQLSARRQRAFCDINCAALPDDLLEAELFGHAKGAFTGAVAERPGLFEAASGGTLFLDEVAERSARAQAKLLRAVQQQEVRRVGESFARPVDVRVVAAANRCLRDEVEAGRFRADLLYRLDVIHLRIPPLRERPDDIAVLAQQFWRAAAERVGSSATLAPGTISVLTRYTWPGNVRELQNVLAALAVVAPIRGQVRPSLLPPVVGAASGVTSARLADARDQFERRYIEVALARAAGNRTHAARALGLSRQGLLKSMSRLGLRSEGNGAT